MSAIMIEMKEVNKKVTSKKFAFAEKHKMPFYFVSAAEGTNVVAAFEHSLQLALDNKLNPPDKFMKDLDDMLADVFFSLKGLDSFSLWSLQNRRTCFQAKKINSKSELLPKPF